MDQSIDSSVFYLPTYDVIVIGGALSGAAFMDPFYSPGMDFHLQQCSKWAWIELTEG